MAQQINVEHAIFTDSSVMNALHHWTAFQSRAGMGHHVNFRVVDRTGSRSTGELLSRTGLQ